MNGGGGAADRGDGRGDRGVAGVVHRRKEKSIMIDSVMKSQEPQMNADERRFVVPALSSSLIDANTNNNHFFAHFAVKNRRLSIIFWFENHKDTEKNGNSLSSPCTLWLMAYAGGIKS